MSLPTKDFDTAATEVVEHTSIPVIVERERHGLVLDNVKDIDTMAARLAKSDLVPTAFRSKQADVFFALSYGLELGMMPIASLRAIGAIDGKPALAADALVGIAMKSGVTRFLNCAEDEDGVSCEAQRVGSPEVLYRSFTHTEAEQAGAAKKGRAYPAHKMEAIAKARMARALLPERLHGIYCPEEIEVFSVTRSALDAIKDELLEVKSLDELGHLGQRAFDELTAAEQEEFRPLYMQLKATLEKADGEVPR